ncbi:hypothetical protein AYI70_g1264 [Smittium culicis]|uniref:Uncharacterized protein n=1 Tax=Smittium culicis TaxID=133412 RepID=A0A1R1YDB9_9FUNG|nr:hypothetical protein AYI70_g1264 [Smittium culicis]
MNSGNGNESIATEKEIISGAVNKTLDLNKQVHDKYMEASDELYYKSIGAGNGQTGIVSSEFDEKIVYIYLYGLTSEDAIYLLSKHLESTEYEHCFIMTNKLNTPSNKTSQLTVEVLDFLDKSRYRFKSFAEENMVGVFSVLVDFLKVT